MSSTAPPPVPDRIGRYKIERKIGEGGMGVVYAARDERLDRTVALKAIRGETDETSRQRLWREARAAAGISHPNICQLYEVEETADGLVMAMELLAGEPLGARVARGPLSPADTSTIALPVLAPLAALRAGGEVARVRSGPADRQQPRRRQRDAPHRVRHHRRDTELHGAGTGARRGARRPRRSLRPGGDALRDVVGEGGVRRPDERPRSPRRVARAPAGPVWRRHGSRARPR